MQEAVFDILSGTPGHNAVWLESVPGFMNARKRIEELAAATPGPYFIFNSWNSTVPVQINTGSKLVRAKARKKTASAA